MSHGVTRGSWAFFSKPGLFHCVSDCKLNTGKLLFGILTMAETKIPGIETFAFLKYLSVCVLTETDQLCTSIKDLTSHT